MNPFMAGTFGLAGSAVLSAVAIGGGLWGWHARDARLQEAARRSVIGIAVLLTLCSAALVAAFLLDRFDLHYVAYNSNRTMPGFYKFSAFWGSLDGSMLLWAWMLSLFSAVAMIRHRTSDRDLLPVVAAVLGAILLFFVGTILATTNPFDPLVDEMGRAFTPPDGLGLNPLLQNPGMVFHPPSLYLGFTGFTIPFAFALAALVTGRLGADWIRNTRRWTLIAWAFLTLGNILGANWAYVELGWGGYWGWDPVENSALMPWFTGTAFLHSVMIQEKKGMLKVWNVSLIMLTFWLTIYGTFLTRSGVVSSVHAFSNGTVGPIFVGFLAVCMAVGLALLYRRWDDLQSTGRIRSVVSREGAFLFNNVALVGLMFATFWGTSFPIFHELWTGQKLTIGAPFFNRINAPIAIGLLLLLGVGPVISWGRMTRSNLRRNLLPPLIHGVIAGVAAFALGARQWYAVFTYVLVVYAASTMATEMFRGAAARRRSLAEAWPRALWNLTMRNRRRYGGYIVHAGMLMLFIGITGNLFAQQTQAALAAGESVEFAGHTIELEGIERRSRRNYDSQMALFNVVGPDGRTQTMWPEKRQYKGGKEETSTEVAIESGPLADLYLIFVSEVPEEGRGVFRFHLNPLVQWIWWGGAVMLLGTIVALGAGRRQSTART